MDSNKIKRIGLFMLGCVVVRLFLVFLAGNISKEYLPLLGTLLLIPAIGFLVIYLGGLRKTGGEVFGEKIWWNNLRPIHSLLYFTFVVMAFRKDENAYIPLLVDVIFGLGAFLFYHFGN